MIRQVVLHHVPLPESTIVSDFMQAFRMTAVFTDRLLFDSFNRFFRISLFPFFPFFLFACFVFISSSSTGRFVSRSNRSDSVWTVINLILHGCCRWFIFLFCFVFFALRRQSDNRKVIKSNKHLVRQAIVYGGHWFIHQTSRAVWSITVNSLRTNQTEKGRCDLFSVAQQSFIIGEMCLAKDIHSFRIEYKYKNIKIIETYFECEPKARSMDGGIDGGGSGTRHKAQPRQQWTSFWENWQWYSFECRKERRKTRSITLIALIWNWLNERNID